MSDGEPELDQLFGELTTTVEQLQEELRDSRGPPRLPTPGQLVEFTSEVTIPAIILALETNVRALRLVQRALRIAGGREAGSSASQARRRADELGRTTLSHLDDTLAGLRSALEGTESDDQARELLDRIRSLESEIEAELESGDHSDPSVDSVDIDVEAELQSIRDDLDDADSHEGN